MSVIKRGNVEITKEYIDNIVDKKNAKQLVNEMLKDIRVNSGIIDNVNWLPLAALHAFVYCLIPIKNDKYWVRNFQREQARIDAAYDKISEILQKLEEKNIMVSSISKRWKAKELDFSRVSVHRMISGGKESQFLLDDGEFYEFNHFLDAKEFVNQFQRCYMLLVFGAEDPEDMELAITVSSVVERLKIRVFAEIG